ncbi:hypothetical protein [Microcoleus sp. bin38.metabat.b11b12b14.051]|nr:hypothetical protein [Microcoleus sp. bin38.metabat.b11b12b14.051]
MQIGEAAPIIPKLMQPDEAGQYIAEAQKGEVEGEILDFRF